MSNEIKNKVTLRERKKAQPNAVYFLSEAERSTIKASVAKDLSDSQFKVFIYTCQALGLNPLLNEIAAVVYGGQMSIQVMRDGFLTIAHRSGKFAGLESGIYETGDKNPYGKEIKTKTSWAKAYNKEFLVPVYQEAEFEEYNAKRNLWITKPNTMIKKVAESMALRKAFNINGVYAPEEMEREVQIVSTPKPLEVAGGDRPATEEQIATLKSLGFEGEVSSKQEAAEKIRELAVK